MKKSYLVKQVCKSSDYSILLLEINTERFCCVETNRSFVNSFQSFPKLIECRIFCSSNFLNILENGYYRGTTVENIITVKEEDMFLGT